MKLRLITMFVFLLLVSACSKTDDSPEPVKPDQQQKPDEVNEPEDVVVLSGKFIDSPVEGLSYATATQSGITNSSGEFNYLAGEEVTFKVGNILLGKALGQAEVTPITLAAQTDPSATINSLTAKNIAAFLQTLDNDQNHDNGIKITESVISALGINTLDFSKSIAADLADAVLNVSKQTGAYLEIIYPEAAAKQMAVSLGLEYTETENLSLTHLLPLLESFYANEVPKSSVYKNTFNENDQLIFTEIILRYSGRVVREIRYDNHNSNALPTTITTTVKSHNILDSGLNYTYNIPTLTQTITYNSNNQVIEFLESGNGFTETFSFTEFTDSNAAVTVIQNYTDNAGIYVENTSFRNTYENGALVYQEMNNVSATNDVEYDYYSSYKNNSSTSMSYDSRLNFKKISTVYAVEGSYQSANQPAYEYVTNSESNNDFTYRDNGTLSERTFITEGSSETNNELTNFNNSRNYTYDENESILKLSVDNSNGYSFERIFAEGYLISSTAFYDDLVTSVTTYQTDRSYSILNYYYDEFNQLDFSYSSDYVLIDGVYVLVKSTYLNSFGELIETLTYEFYEDGTLKLSKSFNADGELNWIDYYNEQGFWVKLEYYDFGELYLYYIFVLDAEGNRLKAEGYNANGDLESIYSYNDYGLVSGVEYFYEGVSDGYDVYVYQDNVLLSIEYYLANGQLFSIEYFENNESVRIDYYDEDGNIASSTGRTGKFFSENISKYRQRRTLNIAKNLHDKYESKTVKRLLKSKYERADKLKLNFK